jgi:acetylornithine deacetylase/succinyl-diaminopimelate desuccinylase-like protein
MKTIFAFVCTLCASISITPAYAQTAGDTRQLSREIFKQLIEINTTDSVGNITTAAEAMAKRLRDAGFSEKDVVVAGPNERKKNLIVRFRGTGRRKPVLFIGHLDVVEARREDWTTDPFEFIEKDGYFYGRGSEDMKNGDAILVTNFIRLKREGFVADRDLILALTADEENGDYNGVDWLLKKHRDWIEAEYCINLDGFEFEKDKGKPLLAGIQASEKVNADYQFESLNPGGHSSVPSPDNAIYHLSGALVRLQSFAFPPKISEITRNYFEHIAPLTSGQTAADFKAVAQQPPDLAAIERLSAKPDYNTLLRTTCVATMLTGGHAPNALPQMARANVNCRIFPGEDPEEVRKTLQRIANDPKVAVRPVVQTTADGKPIPVLSVPPSPLLPEVTGATERTLQVMWPGVPLAATMSAHASDGTFLRIAGIPTFGISCMFFEPADNRSHGKNERVGVQDFYDGVEFCNHLMHQLAGGKP